MLKVPSVREIPTSGFFLIVYVHENKFGIRIILSTLFAFPTITYVFIRPAPVI